MPVPAVQWTECLNSRQQVPECESLLYNDFNKSLSLNLMQYLHRRKGMKRFILLSVILISVALAVCVPAGTVPIKPISTAGVDIVEHNAQGAISDLEKAIALGLDR